MATAPHFTDEQIEWLDELFPDRLPPRDRANEKELWERLGARRVVDRVKAQRRSEEKRTERENRKKNTP